MLGLGLVFLMESMDDSIKFADEVEKVLMVPLLGVIPKIKQRARPEAANMALQAQHDPRGHFAEAYRSVHGAAVLHLWGAAAPGGDQHGQERGQIHHGSGTGHQFCAAGPQNGADRRRHAQPLHPQIPCLGQHQQSVEFFVGPQHGRDFAPGHGIPNLQVITAGPIPPSPVDLLTGPKLGRLMDLLQADGVQFIILDGPPVLGLADAVVLGNQVPSVLAYVAQASLTRKSHIKDAFRRLRMAGIVPRGVVLTKTTAQNTAYYTYDNYYGYGADQAPGGIQGPKTEPVLRRA